MTVEPLNLTWRPLEKSDAAAWADLLNAIEAEDKLGENYDVEDAAEELEDPLLDFGRGTLAAFDGEAMAGYSLVTHRPLAVDVHRMFLQGGVRPSHRRRGIGTRLLRAGTAAARELHAVHQPELKLVIDAQNGDTVTGSLALYEAEGMTATRWYFHMEHPLGDTIPEVNAPEGMAFEAHRAETDAEFLDLRNEAFQDHWGSTAQTPEEWRNRIVNHNFQPEASFLLRDQATGIAAGMLITMCWEADTQARGVRDAHFMYIGTRRAYRKRGVGAALIAHALRAVAEQGYDQASLGVDAANPSGALGLYERAGFVSVERHVRYSVEG